MNHVVKNGSLSIWGFEIWVVYYLMNIDQKFLLWRVLMLFMYLELMRMSLFWGDLEAMRDNPTKILKFYKNSHQWLFSCPVTIFVSSVASSIQWPFSHPLLSPTFSDHFCVQHPMTIFASSDHFESSDQFWVQWPVLSPMTSFNVDVINVYFISIN